MTARKINVSIQTIQPQPTFSRLQPSDQIIIITKRKKKKKKNK